VKLWQRQTFWALMVILLSISLPLALYVRREAGRQLQNAMTEGEQRFSAFLSHLQAFEREGGAQLGMDSTRRAMTQYGFATYARLLQGAGSSYSLVQNGEYLYHLGQVDVAALLPPVTRMISQSGIRMADGRPFLILSRSLMQYERDYVAYHAQDISGVMDNIHSLVRSAQLALLAVAALCGLLLPLLLRRSLSPLRRLQHASERIAAGDLSLRSGITTPDEVGALSQAFDQMADTVSDKIETLTDTTHRQELMLGALSHDMKTPIAAITGYAGQLLRGQVSEEQRLSAAHGIQEAALRSERLSQRMMQLLSLTSEPLNMRTFSAKHLLAEAEKAMRPQAKAAGVVIDAACESDTIYGEPELLLSLLSNLLDNAIKASQPGQIVTLRASESADGVTLMVSDAGHGTG